MTKTTKDIEQVYIDRARKIATICYQKRAEDVKILDLRGLCGYTDFFIIATAASRPQMRGIVKDIQKEMSKEKCRPLGESGVQEGNWVLADYGDMVLHLFDPEYRDFYELEEMWADAPEVEFDTNSKGKDEK